ncbi:protein ImuB [Alteromonadaceae bacterium Bs31]|nr:protein ImuB [Alteromonadaceae bacterium Bs31]
MKSTVNKLWIALRLPMLPMEVFGFYANHSSALIVIHKQQVVCANELAQNNGIKTGMPSSTAGLLVDCQTQERDTSLEQHAMQQLAECLYRYTPYIELQLPNHVTDSGFMIEVSRSIKLFKGLSNIIEHIQQDLKNKHYQFELGLAHTNKGAWLLSFRPPLISKNANRQEFINRLSNLNLSLLAKTPQSTIKCKQLEQHIQNLDKSGFSTLGDITRQIQSQSLASIRKRWGQSFTAFVADIFDIEQQINQPSLFEKPIELYQPEDFFYDSIQFDYPISNLEQLQQPMEFLLNNLSEYLIKRQLHCQKIDWLLFDIYHNRQEISVHCSQAQSQWQLLYELSNIQLEAKTLTFEVDTLELICRNTLPAENHTGKLAFSGNHSADKVKNQQNFAIVTAKLKARLGEQALFKVSYNDSHIPEQSNIKIDINDTAEDSLPAVHLAALRPSWLFNSPQAIQEKQQTLFWRGKLELLQGPERIEGNWWDTPTARDYFMAQREDFLRLWVFYDLQKKRWYVQGVFS